MKRFTILAIFILLAGCGAPNYNITQAFNEKEAEDALRKGNNTIQGEAFLRQQGGGIVTCAGSEVILLPATAYATEMMNALYLSTEKGYNTFFPLRRKVYNFVPNEPRYPELTKRTLCSSTGHFKFKDIKDGSYYIITTINWKVAGNDYWYEGGDLMQKVSVKNGETAEITMHY